MKSISTMLVAMFMSFWSLQVFAADGIVTKQAIYKWISKEASLPKPNRQTMNRIVDAVYSNAKKHDIDPYVILSVIHRESRFKTTAKSSAGAKGLMQVMAPVHRDKIKGRDIFNIETNIEVGTTILADCISRRQTINGALRCYSGGATKYESHLRTAHKSLTRAEVLYRFAMEKPIVVRDAFSQTFINNLQQSKVKIASAE